MIDLHLHLDGALTLSDIKELANMQHISLPEDYESRVHVSSSCQSLNDFLECFDIPTMVTQTYSALKQLTVNVLKRAVQNGLVYVELRFAPQLQTERGMTQEEAVQAVMDGMIQMRDQIDSSLILCYMRHSGNGHRNFETLRIAKKYLHNGVEAVDLAGAEGLYKTGNFAQLFRVTREEGVPFTIHAGEADDWTSVESAISFGAKRIGHGVRALSNDMTASYLASHMIPLELCPTSEVQTHAVNSAQDFPLQAMIKRGLTLTVNTDDPGISNIDLPHEYRFIRKEYGITREQSLELMLNSVDCAFCSADVKKRVRRKILSGFETWYSMFVLHYGKLNSEE